MKHILALILVLFSETSFAGEEYIVRFHYTHPPELDDAIVYEEPLRVTGTRLYINLTNEIEYAVCEIMVENVPETDAAYSLPLVSEDGDEIFYGDRWIHLPEFEQTLLKTVCKLPETVT